MSGHSKWSTIKRQKAVTDTKRSAAFTKLAKAITVAAKTGGADPDMNFRLRLAIQKAKEGNMPLANIERAVAKGAGNAEGIQLTETLYEAYGPDGIGLLIEGVTDNKNRTTSEVRAILTKFGGSLAQANSVAWQFTQKGVIRLTHDQLTKIGKDTFELGCIDAGAEDVKEETEGVTIIASKELFAKISAYVISLQITPVSEGLEWIPSTPVATSHGETLSKLVEQLEEHDDVENVYTNADAS